MPEIFTHENPFEVDTELSEVVLSEASVEVLVADVEAEADSEETEAEALTQAESTETEALLLKAYAVALEKASEYEASL